MSDVSQPSAPPPSAPSTPAPSAPAPQTEVPVNQSPVDTPTPLGDQAPPKPPHVARREALENAFAKAKQAQEEAAAKEPAKRAKPGMGHNQPPEPTAKEAPKAAEKAQQFRDGGKFAKDPAKVQQQPPEQPQPGQQAEAAPQPIKPLDERAPYRDPPGRFRDQAKAEWHATPESVRAGVHQMAKEFQGAYEKFRGDYEVMEELRPYHDLATKQGTSLRKAFDNYYTMEQKCRQDFIGGLEILTQNMRMKHPDGSPVTLLDVAHHIVNMTPEQHRLSQTQNQQSASDQRIGQLHQTVERQSQILDQLIYQQRFSGTRAEVDQFAENHPRFDELADLVKAELDLGFTLEQAYQRADRLRPPMYPQAAQTRTQSAQTRKTSISGAPDSSGTPRPSDGRPRRNGEAKHPTAREALAKAMRRVGNGV